MRIHTLKKKRKCRLSAFSLGLCALLAVTPLLSGCGTPFDPTPTEPTLFRSYTQTEQTLAEGVKQVTNTVEKNNGNTSIVYAIEVDLKKADVIAGTTGNVTREYRWKRSSPYAMALNWEQQTGGQVFAAINGDFFGVDKYGAYMVLNVFVKDGVILKDSHNDTGNYDYKRSGKNGIIAEYDVNVSAPMLFGIKGETAQIGPICQYEGDETSSEIKEKLIHSRLTYTLSGDESMATVLENKVEKGSLVFATNGEVPVGAGRGVMLDATQGYKNMTVLETFRSEQDGVLKPVVGQIAYLYAADEENFSVLDGIGDKVSLTVHSEDGLWDGYTTIMGCRHALVTDGEIARTVPLEFTNNATEEEAPRSAVGIKEDGTVVLFCLESLWYNYFGKPGDPHGMTLMELAQFIYFYGCTQAANFDGGGSSSLVVRSSGESEPHYLVRSSDSVSPLPHKARTVMNSLLVVSKET